MASRSKFFAGSCKTSINILLSGLPHLDTASRLVKKRSIQTFEEFLLASVKDDYLLDDSVNSVLCKMLNMTSSTRKRSPLKCIKEEKSGRYLRRLSMANQLCWPIGITFQRIRQWSRFTLR